MEQRFNVRIFYFLGFICLLTIICQLKISFEQTKRTKNELKLKSISRGHIAILYSGTIRSFSLVFQSHLMNLLIPSPYHVHIFVHASTGKFDWKTPKFEHQHTQIYRGFQSTIDYFHGYLNIDNEYVDLMNDVIQSIEIDDQPLNMNLSEPWNYTEIVRLIDNRYDSESKPLSLIGQLDSLRRANDARLNYENKSNIKYQWIIRLRMDHLMKTNLWQDLFQIEPFHLHNPIHFNLLHRTSTTNRYWNGGLLYDFIYIPRNDSNLNSLDHEISLFVPTCEWWYGITDQFAIGGSIAMTKYSQRMNLPFISMLIQNNSQWKLWAEPFVQQLVDYEQLKVYKLKHVYNIIRVLLRNDSLTENRLLSSDCVYIWYGRDCHRDHCSFWINEFHSIQLQMLNRSKQNRNELLDNEIYANQGVLAENGFTQYISYLHSMTLRTHRNQSNFYYFWRHRSPKQMFECEMPSVNQDPVQALLNPIRTLSHSTQFNLFQYHFYPFIRLTNDLQKHHRYKQHLVCQI